MNGNGSISSSLLTTPSLGYNSELSSDATLFNLLHKPCLSDTDKAAPQHYTFSQALRQQGIPANATKPPKPKQLWLDNFPLDWSLKTQIRFIADQPLPWKHNFKVS